MDESDLPRPSVNQSLVYIDHCGPEPDTSLPDGWRKWSVWFRRRSKSCWSNSIIDEHGRVNYHTLLKSQRTRWVRERTPFGRLLTAKDKRKNLKCLQSLKATKRKPRRYSASVAGLWLFWS